MQTNYSVQDEVQGFKKAMDFFNTPSGLNMSKKMVLQFGKQVQEKTSKGIRSAYGMGFNDAALIIARTRD